jgi:ketosteroid isomerase-like protein
MDADANVARLREAISAYESGELDRFDDFCAPDMRWHFTGQNYRAGDYRGLEDLLELMAGGKKRSVSIELLDVLASDRSVVVFLREHGDDGERTMDVVRAQAVKVGPDGRFTEFWGLVNDQAAEDAYMA